VSKISREQVHFPSCSAGCRMGVMRDTSVHVRYPYCSGTYALLTLNVIAEPNLAALGNNLVMCSFDVKCKCPEPSTKDWHAATQHSASRHTRVWRMLHRTRVWRMLHRLVGDRHWSMMPAIRLDRQGLPQHISSGRYPAENSLRRCTSGRFPRAVVYHVRTIS